MRPEERDVAYIWDMVDAAKSVIQFVEGMDFQGYLGDKKLQAAVERKIEVIGEAAARVSDAFKALHDEIPWRQIIVQRNVLAHEYGEIKQDRIWIVATVKIPELIESLVPLLPQLPPTTEE